jgi:hypothetical protein
VQNIGAIQEVGMDEKAPYISAERERGPSTAQANPGSREGAGAYLNSAKARGDLEGRTNRLSLEEMPARTSLYDRVQRACMDGERENARFRKAQRAAVLMERYPEVCELIDLLRDF